MRARFALLGMLGALGCGSRPPAAVAIAGPPPTPASATPPPAPAAPGPVPAPSALAPVEQAEISDEDEGSPDAADAPPSPGGRGWLGVELEPAGPDEIGARIARIVPKSPAEQAGLQAGDLVTRLDGEPITAPGDVVSVVSQRQAGTRLGVALKRQKADRLATVTLGVFPDPGEVQRMTYVDHPAPPLEQLTVAKGSFTPSLGAQRGQVVVLDFWAPWCVPCRALIPHMNELHARFAARGLRVLGITAEPVARAASAASELGIEYPVAADESGKTTIAYQARAIPSVYVIDRTGTVRDVMVGYDRAKLAKLDELVQRLVTER